MVFQFMKYNNYSLNVNIQYYNIQYSHRFVDIIAKLMLLIRYFDNISAKLIEIYEPLNKKTIFYLLLVTRLISFPNFEIANIILIRSGKYNSNILNYRIN